MPHERPIGVTLVALVQGVNALTSGLEVAALERGLPTNEDVVLAVTGAALGIWGLAVAVGLWRLQRWAWTATMIWVGVVMALALSAYWSGNASYSVMVLSVLQVFYLNQSETQRAFLRRQEATA